MQNTWQISERLANVRDFIEKHFKDDISINQITDIAFYSYRNANRIYKSIYQESIGFTIQRLRMEDAAKEVLYTGKTITEIGFDAGYSDLQAFNKAFKSIYKQSPRQFREANERRINAFQSGNIYKLTGMKLDFKIETFPDMKGFYLTCHGAYDIARIEEYWEDIIEYAEKHGLLAEDAKFIGEILDDEAITVKQKCRYNCFITLSRETEIEPSGFLKTKVIPQQKFATFLHKGSYQSLEKSYPWIYTEWLFQNFHELADKPVLEFYLNDETKVAQNELLTKICIPIL